MIIYDIRDEKRLRKVSKKMEPSGIRVQKSVFEAELNDKDFKRLLFSISGIMKEEDSVVYFKICEKDWQKREKYGVGRYIELEDENYYIL